LRTVMKFNIIFLDPPYQSDEIESVLPYIGELEMLHNDGCVLVEHPSKTVLPDSLRSLRLKKNYKYGDTTITLYRKNDEQKNSDLSGNI
jgi:16S rRNA (guanine966-N2)-methyltransferase